VLRVFRFAAGRFAQPLRPRRWVHPLVRGRASASRFHVAPGSHGRAGSVRIRVPQAFPHGEVLGVFAWWSPFIRIIADVALASDFPVKEHGPDGPYSTQLRGALDDRLDLRSGDPKPEQPEDGLRGSLSPSSSDTHASLPAVGPDAAQAAAASVLPHPGPALTTVSGRAAAASNMADTRGRTTKPGGGRGGASFASNRCLRAPSPTLSACTWRSVRRLRMVASLCGRSAFTATPRVLRDSPVSRYRSPVLVGVPRVDVRTVMLRQVAASCVGALRTWGPPVLRRLSPPEGDNAGRCSSEDDHTRAV
jgi:hypothetical protein